MKNTLRQSMAWLHSWAGLLAGWILFAMFLMGTASYFRPEITAWMQPELTQATDPDRAALTALGHLAGAAPDARQWTVMVPDSRTAGIYAFWRDADGSFGDVTLDGVTGTPAKVPSTRGGEFFYRFHFQLLLPRPWGRWLAGVCAMLMLASIISGVITHRRIFKDFFTFRSGKGLRSWLDAHLIAGVWALPFHAMITYTGLVTLVVLYMPWGIRANYPSQEEYYQETFGDPPPVVAKGVKAPLTDMAPLLLDARRRWDGGGIRRIVVHHPNDAAATIALYRDGSGHVGVWNAPLVYNGTDGRLISNPDPAGPAVATGSVMVGLHVGWFAGPLVRWLYFLSGLMGTAMVGTGLVLWSLKRRVQSRALGRSSFGHRLSEILNIGTIAGLPAGMACYFLANRLLPVDLDGRAGMEMAATFWVWGFIYLLALVRPAGRAWVEAVALTGFLYLLLPVVDISVNPDHVINGLADGHLLMASFDLVFGVIGVGLLLVARFLHRRPGPIPRSLPSS